MTFEFSIDGAIDPFEKCDQIYSYLLKFNQYKLCLKYRNDWLKAQDQVLINRFLAVFCRKESIDDEEIRNYELAFMASWKYHHRVIDREQMADLFIRRYSRMKGYMDTGASFEEACSLDAEAAKAFVPSNDLLLLQGRAFDSIGNDTIKAAYEYIERYAGLYYEDADIFRHLMPDIFSTFNDQFRNLFTDPDKMVVYKITDDSDEITYVPEPGEEIMDEPPVFILCAPNLIAATLEWYGGDFASHIHVVFPGMMDDDDSDEDD